MEPVPRYSLIKRLQRELPRGCPVDLSDLAKLGVSPETAARQARDGWLDRVGHGVYMLPGDVPTAHASVRLLQRYVAGLHVGGRSALALHGVYHNIRFRDTTVLWGDVRFTLPEWFRGRFSARYVHAPLFDWPDDGLARDTLHTPPGQLAGLAVAVPERAVLEMLYEAGTKESLEESRLVLEGMLGPRLSVLGPLLECCTSVKAVRLFLTWSRESGLLDVDALLERYRPRVGSKSRWVGRMKDGTHLTLRPHG